MGAAGSHAAAVAIAVASFAAGLSYPQSTSPFFTARKKAARKAADAAFEAIVKAMEAAQSYISALSAGASEAAAKAYEAITAAAAEARRLVVALIERIHGTAEAMAAKAKLDGLNVLIEVGDVSTDVVRGICSAIVPAALHGTTKDYDPSPVEKLAYSSSERVMGLLTGIGASELVVGLTVPMPVKATICVVAVAGELARAYYHGDLARAVKWPAETST